MKRFLMVAIMLVTLVAALAGTVLADDPPTTCPYGCTPGTGQGRGPGMGPGAGQGGNGPMQPGNGPRMGRPDWAGMDDEVVAILGLTQTQLHDLRAEGKSLTQIAADKGISRDSLIQKLLDTRKAELAKAVAAGQLTQEQADAMLQRMTAVIGAMVDRTTTGPLWNNGQRPNSATPGQGQPNLTRPNQGAPGQGQRNLARPMQRTPGSGPRWGQTQSQ